MLYNHLHIWYNAYNPKCNGGKFMKKNQKQIAALLLLAMLLPLASCGGGETTTDETTTPAVNTETAAETEPLDPMEARKLVSDNLPDKDFEGRSFRILTYDFCVADFVTEGVTGALINDAVHSRNTSVAERYNIALEISADRNSGETKALVQNLVKAGEDSFDLISEHMIDTANLAVTHHYRDWNDFTHVDPTQAWWNQSSYEDLSIAGQSFLLAGSITPYFLTHYYCVYMNKELGDNYGLTDTIYDTVLAGDFTIDYYYSQVQDKWQDLDGDGKMSDADFYGLAAQTTSYASPFIYSFGELTVKQDEEGLPVLDMNEEKFASMVEKIYRLFYESNGTITTDGWDLHRDTFMDNRALFFNGVFEHAISIINDMEADFAILPFPKWDENQQDYLTMSDGSSPLVSVPITAVDTEFIGIITEALAAESWRTVTPAVFDTALKYRGARDETSIKVIEMIEPGGVIDFGFVFGDYNSMGFVMSNLMGAKNSNFASHYASNKASWENRIDKLIEDFLK